MQPPIIEQINFLERNGKIDESMDRIYQYVDSLAVMGFFNEIDEVLKDVDVNDISINTMTTLLSVTWVISDDLPSREDFFSRVEKRLDFLGEDSEEILRGLEE